MSSLCAREQQTIKNSSTPARYRLIHPSMPMFEAMGAFSLWACWRTAHVRLTQGGHGVNAVSRVDWQKTHRLAMQGQWIPKRNRRTVCREAWPPAAQPGH
jgi:hypothetical protein